MDSQISSRGYLSVRTTVIVFAFAAAMYAGFRWWHGHRLATLAAECRAAKVRADWTALAKTSELWTQSQPNSGQAWAMRALAAHETGDLPATAGFLERIPDGDPVAIPSLIELTGLYFEPLKRPVDGVRICERILKINPEVVAAHQRLIHYFAMTLQRGRALRQLREALQRRAESVESYCYFVTLPDLVFDEALTRVNSWIEVLPDEPSLKIASALLRTRDDSVISGNDYELKQIEELRALHRDFPEDLEILTTLLELISRGGDQTEVSDLLKAAPAAAAEDYRMWRIRSAYSLTSGDPETAEKNLREAIRLNPMDWHNWHDLGSLLRLLNRGEDAAKAQELAKFGKELQAVLLSLLEPSKPPKAALDGVLDYAIACGDEFVARNLARRLGRILPDRTPSPNSP